MPNPIPTHVNFPEGHVPFPSGLFDSRLQFYIPPLTLSPSFIPPTTTPMFLIQPILQPTSGGFPHPTSSFETLLPPIGGLWDP